MKNSTRFVYKFDLKRFDLKRLVSKILKNKNFMSKKDLKKTHAVMCEIQDIQEDFSEFLKDAAEEIDRIQNAKKSYCEEPLITFVSEDEGIESGDNEVRYSITSNNSLQANNDLLKRKMLKMAELLIASRDEMKDFKTKMNNKLTNINEMYQELRNELTRKDEIIKSKDDRIKELEEKIQDLENNLNNQSFPSSPIQSSNKEITENTKLLEINNEISIISSSFNKDLNKNILGLSLSNNTIILYLINNNNYYASYTSTVIDLKVESCSLFQITSKYIICVLNNSNIIKIYKYYNVSDDIINYECIKTFPSNYTIPIKSMFIYEENNDDNILLLTNGGDNDTVIQIYNMNGNNLTSYYTFQMNHNNYTYNNYTNEFCYYGSSNNVTIYQLVSGETVNKIIEKKCIIKCDSRINKVEISDNNNNYIVITEKGEIIIYNYDVESKEVNKLYEITTIKVDNIISLYYDENKKEFVIVLRDSIKYYSLQMNEIRASYSMDVSAVKSYKRNNSLFVIQEDNQVVSYRI